jgi:hypothetical protein
MRARHDDYGGTSTPHWQSHHIGSRSKIQFFEGGNDERADNRRLVLISANTPAHADVIGDWNNTAMDMMKAVNVGGNPWTRSMAPVNVSMSDAVNSVQNRYSRYIPELPTDPNASALAAAAAAAREILMRQYPGQKDWIDAAFAETMKSIPDNPA